MMQSKIITSVVDDNTTTRPRLQLSRLLVKSCKRGNWTFRAGKLSSQHLLRSYCTTHDLEMVSRQRSWR